MNFERTSDSNSWTAFGESGMFSKEQRTLYVVDHHQEHAMPQSGWVRHQLIWDNYSVEEVFQDAGIDGDSRSGRVETFMTQVFEKRAKEALVEGRLATTKDLAYEGNIWEVRIYLIEDETKEQFEARVNKWLDDFEALVKKAIDGAGGDDDFYDYMPNYVDMFRQVCEILGEADRYNNMIAQYLKHEREFEFHAESI